MVKWNNHIQPTTSGPHSSLEWIPVLSKKSFQDLLQYVLRESDTGICLNIQKEIKM